MRPCLVSGVLAALAVLGCDPSTPTLGSAAANHPSAGAGGAPTAGGAAGTVAGGQGGSAPAGRAGEGGGGSTDRGIGGTAGSSGEASGGFSASGSGGGGASAGSAGASAGSAGASAGSAGAAVACVVAADGPPIGIDAVPFDEQRELSPLLVRSDQPGKATLVYHWTSQPGSTVTGARYLPLDPFGAWPTSDLGPTFGGEPYELGAVLAASPAFDADGVSVLVRDLGLSAETGAVSFLASVRPPFASSPAVVLQNADAAEPRFVARGSSGHAVGYQIQSAGADGVVHYGLRGGAVAKGGLYVEDAALGAHACALAPLHADATSIADSYLIATSTSRACCACEGSDGPPTRVMVHVLQKPASVTEVVVGGPVTLVRLVPRSEGAWLVVGWDAGASGTRVEVGRVDAAGKLLGELSPVPGLALTSPFAVTGLGDSVVLSWLEQSFSGSRARLRIIGPATGSGELLSEHPWAARAPALLASPDGARVLLAWSHPMAGPGNEDRMALARFAVACAP